MVKSHIYIAFDLAEWQGLLHRQLKTTTGQIFYLWPWPQYLNVGLHSQDCIKVLFSEFTIFQIITLIILSGLLTNMIVLQCTLYCRSFRFTPFAPNSLRKIVLFRSWTWDGNDYFEWYSLQCTQWTNGWMITPGSSNKKQLRTRTHAPFVKWKEFRSTQLNIGETKIIMRLSLLSSSGTPKGHILSCIYFAV